jgi:hypothetical protein
MQCSAQCKPLSDKQAAQTDACRVLEQAAGNKAPWAQTLSFVHPFDPAFADANPTASLAELQSVLHTTALGFLWDTDRLPGGPEACCKEPQRYTREGHHSGQLRREVPRVLCRGRQEAVHFRTQASLHLQG